MAVQKSRICLERQVLPEKGNSTADLCISTVGSEERWEMGDGKGKRMNGGISQINLLKKFRL